METIISLNERGKSLIGKTAQSNLLTEISSRGNKVLRAPMVITAYEVVEIHREKCLMITIDGDEVLEEYLINIAG